MPEMMYLKGRLLGKGKQTSTKTLDVFRYILPAYYFFLGRCSVEGIVFSKMTCCWHRINASHIRCGSQQKAPGWFSINYEARLSPLSKSIQLLWSAHSQEHSVGGSQHLSKGMSTHGCSAWSLQGEGGGPWDCRMRCMARGVFQ